MIDVLESKISMPHIPNFVFRHNNRSFFSLWTRISRRLWRFMLLFGPFNCLQGWHDDVFIYGGFVEAFLFDEEFLENRICFGHLNMNNFVFFFLIILLINRLIINSCLVSHSQATTILIGHRRRSFKANYWWFLDKKAFRCCIIFLCLRCRCWYRLNR